MFLCLYISFITIIIIYVVFLCLWGERGEKATLGLVLVFFFLLFKFFGGVVVACVPDKSLFKKKISDKILNKIVKN